MEIISPIILEDLSSSPAAPSSGKISFYFKNGLPYYKKSNNTETVFGDEGTVSAQLIEINANTTGIIGTTLSSITDNSASKPYVIKLTPGIYIEDTITSKPYVAIIGDSYNTTFIEVNATNKDVIIGADQSMISNVTLRGATDSGKCAIKYSSSSGIATAFFNVENVRFGANNILIKTIGTGGQVCAVQCTNVKYGGTGNEFDIGFWATFDGISGSSTIQLRSVTTTNGSIASPITVFALADGANCQIVCNSAQVNKSGTTTGIAFQAINAGSLRLTAVNIRNWATGIDMPNIGAATNVSAIGCNFELNTIDLNVAHTAATGKVEGAIKEKTIINDSSTVYVVGINRYTITVRKQGGDFTTINDALNFITDNSSTNIYLIDVGAGVFTTSLVNLSAKPWVNIRGASINSTIIRPSANNHHVFQIGEMNEISFMTIENAGSGFAGVYSSNGGIFSQLHKITFNNCDTGILVENTNVETEFYAEYVDFSGTFAYGIRVANNGSSSLFVNAENCYCFPTSGINTCYLITGSNADFHLELSGNENNSGSIGGKGIEWHSGANVDVSAVYFYNFDTAISMPNTGAAPVGHFIAVKTENCTTDLSIQHTGGQGSFQGVMNNPSISIVSDATFGVQYFESLLGNKKEIYFDAASFNPSSGTTPTSSAATRSVLTATGNSFLAYSGTGSTVFNASVNFRIPKDYLRNARFKVIYTSATNANNIRWQFIITNKAIGQDLATQTETGLGVTVPAVTQYNVAETPWIVPTTSFAMGDTVSIRVYRDPSNAADTANVDAYIQGLIFEYEGSK